MFTMHAFGKARALRTNSFRMENGAYSSWQKAASCSCVQPGLIEEAARRRRHDTHTHRRGASDWACNEVNGA
jgi:hypothetical protein